MRLMPIGVLLLSLLLIVPSVGQAQQVDTRAGVTLWNAQGPVGTTNVGGGIQGWGQVFTTPTATTYLESFSFWMKAQPGWGDSRFRAHLATWDAGTSTFVDIWSSAERAVTPTDPLSSPLSGPTGAFGEQAFGVAPGTQLSAGQTYVAYLQASWYDASDPNPDKADWVLGRAVAGGGLRVFDENGVDTSSPYNGNGDLAFTATFSATPEPSTVLFLLTGLVGIGGMGWVRRRRNA